MQKSKLKIIVDSKEKQPLLFSTYEAETYRDSLSAGDYTLFSHDRPNDDHSIIIERKKNCMELVSNLVAKWDVFQRELEKLQTYRHKAIVVCGPNNFLELYERGMTQVHPSFAYAKLAEVLMIYEVPTIFAGSREEAENIIFRMFTRAKTLSYE